MVYAKRCQPSPQYIQFQIDDGISQKYEYYQLAKNNPFGGHCLNLRLEELF